MSTYGFSPRSISDATTKWWASSKRSPCGFPSAPSLLDDRIDHPRHGPPQPRAPLRPQREAKNRRRRDRQQQRRPSEVPDVQRVEVGLEEESERREREAVARAGGEPRRQDDPGGEGG